MNSTAEHYERIKALYSPERSTLSFTEAVFVRPGMYTINGTLEEVGAFLEGFYSGMAVHNRNPDAKAEAQRWFDFCVWAADYVDGALPGGWYRLFQALRRLYSDDSAALVRLAELYTAFRQTHTDMPE